MYGETPCIAQKSSCSGALASEIVGDRCVTPGTIFSLKYAVVTWPLFENSFTSMGAAFVSLLGRRSSYEVDTEFGREKKRTKKEKAGVGRWP